VLPDDFPNEGLGTSGKRGKIVGDIVPVRDTSGDGLVLRHQLFHGLPTLMNPHPLPKVVGVYPPTQACP